MRIGIDARVLQGEMRGQGQYLYYLVKNLLEIDQDNEYVLFYNGFKKGSFAFPERETNLKQIWCRIPGRVLRSSWPGLNFPPIEYLIGGVDVFHSPFNFNFTHYTPIPSRALMIATFNGAGDPAKMWEAFDVRKINQWYQIIAKRADQVIAVSENVKKDLMGKVKIPEDKIKVVYYGVSDDFKLMEDKLKIEAVLKKYGLSGKRYILYVGAAEKNKNLSGLLRAFANIRLQAQAEDVCLVLAGKIDIAYRKIIQESEELGLGSGVIFTDFIPHSELPFIYNRALVFVLPSFYEGFGIPIIEAMACGVPVAVSSCGGMPEVAHDAALFFNPADPGEISSVLSKLISDQGLRQDLKSKGFARANDFTWKKTAENTLAVYKEVKA